MWRNLHNYEFSIVGENSVLKFKFYLQFNISGIIHGEHCLPIQRINCKFLNCQSCELVNFYDKIEKIILTGGEVFE